MKNLRALLAKIASQATQIDWIHTLGKPALSASIQHLPLALQELYKAADGMELHHIQFRGEIVGTALEVLPVNEVVSLNLAMYGKLDEQEMSRTQSWLAICRGSDSAFYIAVDPASDNYYSVNPIVPSEAELVAKSAEEFFEWLGTQLPTEEQMQAALAQRAA